MKARIAIFIIMGVLLSGCWNYGRWGRGNGPRRDPGNCPYRNSISNEQPQDSVV